MWPQRPVCACRTSACRPAVSPTANPAGRETRRLSVHMIAYEPPAQPAIDLAATGVASTTLVPIEPIARLSRTRPRVLRQSTDLLRGATAAVAGRVLAAT